MKDLIEWIKSWPTNKLTLSYLFFFFTYNWPLLTYVYSYASYYAPKDASLFSLANNYLAANSPNSLLCPFFLSLAYVIVSPWISYLIERANSAPHKMREIGRIRDENEILIASNTNLSLRAKSLSKEAEVKKLEAQSASPDARIFSELNSFLPEPEFLRITNADNLIINEKTVISINDANRINNYIRRARSVENEFENPEIKRLHEAFVSQLEILTVYFKLNLESSLDTGFTIDPEYDFESLNSLYKSYRRKVKELLGL